MTVKRKHPMNSRLKRPLTQSCLGIMLLTGLASSVFALERNGIEKAQVGSLCTTIEYSIVANTLRDLERAKAMLMSSDDTALKKFETEGRIARTKGGIPVFVEDRQGVMVRVRLKGETDSGWILATGLSCPAAVEKNTP
jgi:hypothetical protein